MRINLNVLGLKLRANMRKDLLWRLHSWQWPTSERLAMTKGRQFCKYLDYSNQYVRTPTGLFRIGEILVELFCGENELDDCNREINRLTPKLSAHTFVNAFTALHKTILQVSRLFQSICQNTLGALPRMLTINCVSWGNQHECNLTASCKYEKRSFMTVAQLTMANKRAFGNDQRKTETKG